MKAAEQKSEILLAVGECLHTWSIVELEIGNLYMVFHGIRRDEFSHPIRIAFEEIVSLEIRLAMMGAYAEADGSLRQSYLPHFQPLRARIMKLYKKRHEIAHFTLVGRGDMEHPKILVKPFFTWSNFIAKKGPELNAAQIVERELKFSAIIPRIKRHIQHIGAMRALPLEHYVQAGDQAFPPLGPADLIQLAHEQPPQSSPE